MSNNTYFLSVYFNRQRACAGSIPISLYVRFKGAKFYFSTGLSSSEVFDNLIFPSSESNSKAKTRRLMALYDATEEILISGAHYPPSKIKNEILSRVFDVHEKVKPLYEYIQDFAATKSEPSTIEKYIGTAKKVKSFDPHADWDIDCAWLERFTSEMLKTQKVNTVSIHQRNIRAVFNWAIRNEWTDKYPFKRFKIIHEATRKRNLPIYKVRELRDMNNLPRIQERARDIFMLMFYLIGINMKDLLLAKPEQYIDGRLEYIRAKTKKSYSIKVEPEAAALIDKYKGKDHLLNFCDNMTLHSLTCTINRSLKELIPGITTYWSRHSWATIAYYSGISKDVISQALGHSSGSGVTEIYIERDYRLVDAANRIVIDALNADKKTPTLTTTE